IDPVTGEAATSSKEAERIEEMMREAIINGVYGQATKNVTFAEFARNVYLVWIIAHRRSKAWFTIMVEMLCRRFGEMPLRKITTDDIEKDLIARREETSSRGGQRAGSSVNRERAVLSGIFTLAIKKGYYSGPNPVRGVDRFEEVGQRKRVLNHDEE